MTEDDLLEEARRLGHPDREPPPVRREAVWERIQAELAANQRRGLARRVVIPLLAVAAVLALLVGGIRGRRRPVQGGRDDAMTVASAVVIQRYLAQSDTMIGAYRSAVANGTWDEQLTERTRDLLLATRRIQGGRIRADSALVGLLADLDLVFTEIAGYGDPETDRGAESEMIGSSIAERRVLPRLRTARGDAAARARVNEGLEP